MRFQGSRVYGLGLSPGLGDELHLRLGGEDDEVVVGVVRHVVACTELQVTQAVVRLADAQQPLALVRGHGSTINDYPAALYLGQDCAGEEGKGMGEKLSKDVYATRHPLVFLFFERRFLGGVVVVVVNTK